MKKCRKWEPIAHSATVAILFPHLEIRMIEKDRYTALPGRCHIRLRNKFACDVVVLCARVVHERWRGVRADRNVHGMATTPTAADRVSPARPPPRDRPSLDGASPLWARAPPYRPQRTSTSYFGWTIRVAKRFQVSSFYGRLVRFRMCQSLSAIARFEESCFFVWATAACRASLASGDRENGAARGYLTPHIL